MSQGKRKRDSVVEAGSVGNDSQTGSSNGSPHSVPFTAQTILLKHQRLRRVDAYFSAPVTLSPSSSCESDDDGDADDKQTEAKASAAPTLDSSREVPTILTAFSVPPRASNQQFAGVLAPLAQYAAARPVNQYGWAQELLKREGPAVTIGKAVQPAGQYVGHCAFVSLIRSSGAELEPKTELTLCMAMRRLAVAHLAARLLHEEDDFAGLLVAASADADPSTSGRRGRGKGASSSASGAPESRMWAAAHSYLLGMLQPVALAESQYAGALEIAAVAERLGRAVVVLVEADNKSDVGGLWLPGSTSQGALAAPPLVTVNTRRRHMYPLVVCPSQAVPLHADGVVAATEALLWALRQSVGSSDGKGGAAAACVRAVIAAF